MIILVTGAARSGKSEWAENLATQTKLPVIYVATSLRDPSDAEWAQRLQKHQDRRPKSWQTQEVPINLTQALQTDTSGNCVLVDSLGTWVANLLTKDDNAWDQILADFLDILQTTSAHVILVAEETGWGVVPAFAAGRIFRDRLGTLIKLVGGIANPVYLVAGGHVLDLSILGVPLPKN